MTKQEYNIIKRQLVITGFMGGTAYVTERVMMVNGFILLCNMLVLLMNLIKDQTFHPISESILRFGGFFYFGFFFINIISKRLFIGLYKRWNEGWKVFD